MLDQEFFDFTILVAFLAVFFIGNAHCCPEHSRLSNHAKNGMSELQMEVPVSNASEHGAAQSISSNNNFTDLATAVLN